MLLKRLELHGLKSFADKTVLDLKSNVTAIVGPNGSGKSNITDGIRWLLGERDARNLRGTRGEDLIFAGTEKRARMGLAQATLFFDNSSGFFPVDFKEVSISRKISRDGSSQFFINKSEVRLKDLIDFLAKVKLGARGLSVINQGQSDVFITANPTERREMIEEILGLKEFQLKKADAVRKLRNTSFNLEKVGAMLDELKPHLRLLRRQSSRYENRERIAEELMELENNFYGGRFERLKRELKKLEEKEVEIDKKLKEEKPLFSAIEKDFQKISDNEPKGNTGLKEIQDKKKHILGERARIERELGKLEAQIEFSTGNVSSSFDAERAIKLIRNIAKNILNEVNIEKIKDGIRKIIEILDGGSEKKTENNKENELKREQKELLEKLEELSAKSEELANREKEYQKTLEGFNKNFRDAYERVEEERKKLEEIKSQKSATLLSKERINLKLESLRDELVQIGRSVASIEEAVSRGDISAETLIDEDDAVRKMFKFRQELASIGEIDESIIKEAKETEERYRFLNGQVEDLEKAMKDLKSLISDLETKIYTEFNSAIKDINEEFTKIVQGMFGGGKAKLVIQKPKQIISKKNGDDEKPEGEKTQHENEKTQKESAGVDIDISLPKKKVKGLDVLSGGERSLVSIAGLFALISVSPPPFLVLDEIDAALDEKNAKKFGQILDEFSKHTQFVVVTHNRATMESADVLYGVTMSSDGASKLVSLKLT